MVKVRVLVRVVSFLRSRERAFLSDDVVVPFRLKTMKREQQKTPNDARQKRSRGDATGKSRPRGHAKTASAFIDDIFSSDDETIKARSAQNAFLGNVFTAPLLGRDSRWWRFGTARFKARADLYLYLSLSLSQQPLQKHTTKQIGKTKISLPPPKEIAKYACYILGLWAFVAGLFGALLSISVQMRRYKYRSLPQKFIGKFKYGDKADITYPTYSRGLYPWIAASAASAGCPRELTTDSNPNSYVNNDVTLWPTCVPTDTVSNPNRFPVDANCGRACQNP